MAEIPSIAQLQRRPAPAVTPQALAWHNGVLWMGSRDLRRIYAIDPQSWTVREEHEAPGIPWAAVSDGSSLWFTLGLGEDDDRYVRPYQPGVGFADESEQFACPEFTGSYLSHDGSNLYLSQWYNFRILKLDGKGNILREIAVGAEISGHTFVNGLVYVLRGTEQNGGDWRLARLDPRKETPEVEELARVPFQCRSLAFDGEHLWTNHREADQIVCFAMPE